MTFQMIYSMLLYLKNSGSNQRKTKTVLIDWSCKIYIWLHIRANNDVSPKHIPISSELYND